MGREGGGVNVCYCILIVPLCLLPIWQTVQYPVILINLMNRPFRTMGGVYDIQ